MESFDTKRFEIDFANRTLPYLVESRARELGDKVFFMFEDQRVSYRQLDENSNKVANSLLDMGVKNGDKICFMMKNSIEFIYSWFALSKVGAIMVPVNPTLKGNLLQYIIDNSDATVAFVDNDLLERVKFIEADIQKIHRIITVEENLEYNEEVKFKDIKLLDFKDLMTGSTSAPDILIHPSDIISILYTSGTTGPSKGAMLSHHYYYNTA